VRRDRDYPAAAFFRRPVPHLGLLPERLAEVYGDRPALQILRDGQLKRLSYRDLARQVASLACALQALDVRPGDRVLLVGENSPEWIVAAFAIAAAGAIVVPLDPQATEAELWNLSAHAAPRGAFMAPRLRPVLQAALGSDAAFMIDLIPAGIVRDEDPAQELPDPLAGMDPARTVAALLYTSGTTGRPKGVMLTHRNLLFNAERCAEVLYVKPHDNGFALLPLHHAFSFTCLLVTLACGGPATLPTSLKPDRVAAVMRETRVTALPAVPLLIDHLAGAIQEELDRLPPVRAWIMRGLIRISGALRPILGAGCSRRLCAPLLDKLGGLRLLISGGAPLSPASAAFFHALGVTVLNGYGLTETAPVLTLTPTPWRPGDGVGKPLRGVSIRLGPPNAEGLGEVLVRSEGVMLGYYRDAEATAEVLEDGWLNTQDLGRIDERGRLHLHGRSKHVIVLASGKNVYPEDLEAHYGASPLIQELCVLPGRAPDGSEFPLGWIVPDRRAFAAQHPEAQAPEAIREVLSRELVRLSQGLADYQRLKRFEVSEEPLPRTASRKLQRHRLPGG
jgi:long-chain acyl-CoA synthetase